MGFFYSLFFKNKKDEDVEIQFKSLDGYDNPQSYEIGSDVDLWDGIHFDFSGCFVVKDKKIVAAFDIDDKPLFTKWGGEIPYPYLIK